MNKKLQVAMFAVTGLSLPTAAHADIRAAQVTKVVGASPTDTAPVTNTTPARLRRTDEEQPGQEMAHLAFFADGVHGLMFSMSTDLPGANPATVGGKNGTTLANDRIQLSAIPFALNLNTDGTVSAVADITKSRYVTNNNGNEYRNANHPIAFAINNGTSICAEYNYQPNNTNNTERYLQCFDQTGATILPQTRIYQKNNDDCSMNQDKNSSWVVSQTATATKIVAWRGCNGNGSDDGWAQVYSITPNAAKPGQLKFTQQFDVSLCPREERSHGMCTTSAADPTTAICTWTEGNTQPQRDGTWMAAIKLDDTITGTNQQKAILWKQQIDGRKVSPDGIRTYSMRAMQDRVMQPDASGKLVASDLIFWRSGDVRGNNNTNNGKGGTYYHNQMAVIQADRTGMKYVMPMTDMASKLIGLDGTHLGMSAALFGSSDNLMPGLVFLGGSQTGGGYSAQLRAVGWDKTASSLKDLGMFAAGPYDRHLYPNYLGNNPGNQGRNYSGMELVANPFVGTAAQGGTVSTDQYLMVVTSTGKDPTDVMYPERKLSAYISVIPVAQKATAGTGGGSGSGSGTGGGTGGGSGSGSGSDTGSGTSGSDSTNQQPATDPGATLGGCSTSNGSTGATFAGLLIGLAAFIRRRK